MKCVLADIADVTMGQSPKSEYYNSEKNGMPFLQGNRTFGKKYPTFDTYTTFITKTAKSGDVIMSVRAPVGDVNITPIDMCLGRGVCGIRMKNENQEFLFYLLKYYMPRLVNKQSGTVFGSVNKNDINSLEIDIQEDSTIQRKIARYLSMIDEKIELNEKINKNLEQQATAIFSNLAKNSPSKKPLSDFIRIKHGYAFKGDYISTEDNGIVLVTPGNFCIGGGFKESKCKYFIAEYPEDYVLQPDSLIVTMTDLSKEADTLGFGALVPRSSERVYLHNQRIGLVEPLNNDLPISFLYWYMRSYEYHMKIVGSASGSTVKHTSPGRILEQLIPIPKKEDLLKYGAILDAIDNIVSRNNAENIYLQSLREVLLPKLMSGEITVDDAVF